MVIKKIKGSEIVCNECDKVFEDRKSLQFHKLKMHDNSEIEEEMETHEEEVEIHEEEIEIQEEEIEIQEEFTQGMEDEQEQEQEIMSIEIQSELNCRFCNKKFSDNMEFIKHMENDHG